MDIKIAWINPSYLIFSVLANPWNKSYLQFKQFLVYYLLSIQSFDNFV